MNSKGKDPAPGQDEGEDVAAAGAGDEPLEPVERGDEHGEIDNYEELDATGKVKQAPLVPVGRVDLMREQESKIEQIEVDTVTLTQPPPLALIAQDGSLALIERGSVDLPSVRCQDSRMLKRYITTSFLVVALATCGSDEKQSDTEGKDKSGETESGDKARSSLANQDGKPGQVPSGPGSKKSLFGGAFAGVLGGLGGQPAIKLDLANAFGKKLPNLTPQMSKNVAALKDTGLTQDLWSLAPANAAFGMVVGDGTVDKSSRAVAELKRLLLAQPLGAELVDKMRAGIANGSDFDIFDAQAWSKAAGLDLSKGAAVFASPTGEALIILPVVDAPAFFKATGNDGDFGPGNCIADSGRYLCAKDVAYAKAAVAAHDSPLATRVASLPGWLRGDIEIVAHLASFPKAAEEMAQLSPALSNIVTLAIGGRLDICSLAVRGWLDVKSTGPIGGAMAQIPKATMQSLSGGAVNWFHLRLPMGIIMAASDMDKSMPIPGGAGVDLRRDLFDNLTGEMLAYSRGKYFLAEHLVFGLKDPAPTAKAVAVLCDMVKQQGALNDVQQQGTSCKGKLDLGKLLAAEQNIAPFVEGMPEIDIVVAVNGNNLEIRIGKVSKPSGSAGDNAGNAIAKEMLNGEWHAVQWGVAFDPLAITPQILTERIDKGILANIPAENMAQLTMMRWLYSHIYDSGVAMALRDDGMYMTAQVTTLAGDPPEAYAAYEKALNLLLARDYAGHKAAIKQLVVQYPNTLAGRHAKMVGNVPMLGQAGAVGIVAAWAIINKKN